MTIASSGASAASSSASPTSAKGGSARSAKPVAKRRPQPHPPKVPGIARVVAIANQKGGVGKSTTAVSLGAALADLGYRVLVVDLDPQGNASTGMGIRHEAREVTVYDVVVGEAPIDEAIVHTPIERLHAIPSTIDLAGAEIELVSQFSREARLKKALSTVREGVYDFVLMDCPPSLGLLTVNALTAAEELIVPIQCEYYALEGLGQLLRNVSLVQQNINPGLRLSGIVMTMFDPRTKLSEQVVEEVRNYFGELMYDVIIPRTVRLSEAPGYGQPITVYDPKSKGAESYRELAREVALRPPPAEPMPRYEDLPTVVMPAPVGDTVTPAPLDEDDLEEIPTVHATVEHVEADSWPAETSAAEDELEVDSTQAEVTDAIETVLDEAEDAQAMEAEAQAMETQAMEAQAMEAQAMEAQAMEAQARATESGPPASSSPRARAEPGPLQDLDDLWEDVDEAEPPPRVQPPAAPPPPGQLPERRVVVIDEDADMSVPSPPPPSEPSGDEDATSGVADIGATLEDEGQGRRRWRLFRKGGE